MPLQNRVDPWGALQRTPARGAWMGNRGCLHDHRREIVSFSKRNAWVTCQLEYNGRHRQVFAPNQYSELFFLDEATALAAGHRPCGTCRRDQYRDFVALWCRANRGGASATVAEIDRQLHAERCLPGGRKVTFELPFAELPDGAFCVLGTAAALMWGRQPWRWSFDGYTPCPARPAPADRVAVLTPHSVVRMLDLGLRPQVHPSAGSRKPDSP